MKFPNYFEAVPYRQMLSDYPLGASFVAPGPTHLCLNSLSRGSRPLQQLATAIRMKQAHADVL